MDRLRDIAESVEIRPIDNPKNFVKACTVLDATRLPLRGLYYINMFGAFDIQGKLYGTVGYEDFEDHALIRSLAVAPSMQFLGLGTRLLQFVMDHLTDNFYQYVFAVTEMAGEFFTKLGFRQVSEDELPETVRRTYLVSMEYANTRSSMYYMRELYPGPRPLDLETPRQTIVRPLADLN
jgi:N-acetylglutamate synthase-like GNAT family acetyltransferase